MTARLTAIGLTLACADQVCVEVFRRSLKIVSQMTALQKPFTPRRPRRTRRKTKEFKYPCWESAR